MMMMKGLLFLGGISLCASFAPSNNGAVSTLRNHVSTPSSSSTTSLNDMYAQEFAAEIEASRSAFFIWFFGASGAAGIARSSFPRMYQQVTYIQSLAGAGATENSDKLGISPLCGYPDDLSVKDVQSVVNNKLTVEQMVEKFPVEGNFLSRKGYLTFKAFEQANPNASPLTTRAIFDTFAQSTDVCDPRIAQQKLDSYKEDISRINGALLYSKFSGFLAIAVLLFLLGLADIVAAGHAYHGWFPEWPGGKNFPWCILDSETGPWHIPDYWI